MAKKTKKKASKKSGKPAKATKKKGSRKTKGSLSPKPVKTGKGANPMELGTALVQMVRSGEFEPNDRLWSPRFSSVEGHGVAMEWAGKKAVAAKNAEWSERNAVHNISVEGPYVGASGFAVKFQMEVEDKASGQRTTMNEIGVYTIQNGKIVREEFMYSMS